MVIVFIFAAHIIFAGYIFYKKLKTESFSSAAINVAFITLIFSVGWPISTLIVKVFLEPEGFGKFVDRDTVSLLLLTLLEYFFYKFYYSDIKKTIPNGTER